MNIVDLLNEYRIENRTEGHEHCRSGWAQIDCPFCSPNSGRFRLGINTHYVYANCWTCGAKSITSVLKALLGTRWKDAKVLLQNIRPERPEKIVHTGRYAEPMGVMGMLTPHKIYLRDRGFDATELERLWFLRGIGISSRLSWRIFIPILLHGQAVSWTTRTIGNGDHGKYLSAAPDEESVSHKSILYGEDYCRHAIVVVEGPADVWGGGPGFAATLGLSVTSEQVERITKYPVRALCFDNEPQAQKVQKEMADRLACFPGETYTITLDSKDPGEAKRKEILRIRKEVLE